ncbi:uracil-DNA glycosylase family protein [Roseibacillus ishigakijimensis]|uniref:Single-stranded DNA-binding protein n=1 Tax=Roseibacillus ishigakijimensis TaxID=454146 RepID=A0A934VJU9_9BACT|nr:uracil-DNA glycosylase family protein [Roseibacillus ishigakijimensis]MBK1832984.1 single-stranded DNA-binding protein [Roseibacillus ishigakijimensis]
MNALLAAADSLRQNLRGLSFPDPVAYTYNPLEYAWDRHCDYLQKYGQGPKRVLFLGMNPGPYGMAQTGVPFGEIEHVRDWMGISGPVAKPQPEHPKRPITGFACPRSEVSGRRLWGLFAEKFGTADQFFADHFVANYCPLVWMKDTGANLTPDKLPADSLAPVEEHCQAHLRTLIELLQPQFLIGVGAYAEKKLAEAAGTRKEEFTFGRILHPSPASPAANRDFAGTAWRQLGELGIVS